MVRPYRKRYIVFHVLSPDDVGIGLMISMIRKLTGALPEDRYALIKPWFVYFENGWGIVKCRMEGAGDLLEMINSLDGKEFRNGRMSIRTVGMSGTLRGAFMKHIPEKAREGLHYRPPRE